MKEAELMSCPFCGYKKVHIRTKTAIRPAYDESGNPVTHHVEEYVTAAGHAGFMGCDVAVYDGRMGAQAWCGKCKAKTKYYWGEWHKYEDDGLEDYPRHWTYEFHDEPDKEAIAQAIEAWNRRNGDA